MAESVAYARRGFKGGCVATTIPAGINAGATTATLADASTWAGVLANGNARCMINRTGATPEEIEISGLSGNDITISARGLQGTSDVTHTAGVSIEVIHSPRDFNEANYAVSETVGKITAAESLLVSDAANSLIELPVAASRFVGRKASGSVAAMTVAEAVTLLQGTELAEYIADTVGAMVTGNTESGITVEYQDADNTLDFTVSAARTIVRKSATESVTSSTALQNDDHLSFSALANTSYLVEASLIVGGATGGDIKVGWSLPAGTTFNWTGIGPALTATDEAAADGAFHYGAEASALSFGVTGASADQTVVRITGILRTAGTAGTVNLQWAQNASSGTATTVREDSYLTYQAA